MFKIIGIGVLVIIVALVGYAAVQPSEYFISREISIRASADKIFPHLNNAKLMNAWSPWAELDPKAKMSFTGPEEGVGSRTSWADGEQLGTGSATVVESVPNERVRTKLEYIKPFEGVQDAEMSIKPSGTGSLVIWSVRGQNNLIGRLMCMFMNMDKMVGGTFEKGLSTLKSRVESGK